ncbi:hypothetical protein FACS189434_12350 [Bacteroidia bacterium]|nr:hypothetical protein FACS189434_12350 [Bacteroidia bacterium]
MTKGQRDFAVKFIYSIDSAALTPEKLTFKKVDYNPDDYFSKPFTNEETNSCWDTIQRTATLKFHNFLDDIRLRLTVNVTEKVGEAPSIDAFLLDKFKNCILYENDSVKLNIQNAGQNVEFNWNLDNDNVKDYTIRKIYREYPLPSNDMDSSKFSGYLVMEVGFLVGYSSVHLSNTDIGKTFVLDKDTLEIVNIFGNNVILKGNSENIKIINFLADKKVVKPTGDTFTFASVGIYKSNYENIYLKKMTFEEFDKLMTVEKIKEMKNEEQYRIIKNAADIGKKFMLYKPVYRTEYLKVDYKIAH